MVIRPRPAFQPAPSKSLEIPSERKCGQRRVIELDVEARRIRLDVSHEEFDRRRTKWSAPVDSMKGGYQQLYVEGVMQANTGADLDFLTGCRGDDIPRESH
jgi:L-arabonate dehydrase